MRIGAAGASSPDLRTSGKTARPPARGRVLRMQRGPGSHTEEDRSNLTVRGRLASVQGTKIAGRKGLKG